MKTKPKRKIIQINENYLNSRISKKFGKQKWILFCEELLAQGFKIEMYEAIKTVSKYITVSKGAKKFLVRFSNHSPKHNLEIKGTCDFFVGVCNLKTTTTKDALKAVYKFFEEG